MIWAALAIVFLVFAHQLHRIHRRIWTMDQNETQAFADLNAKTDTLIALTESALSTMLELKTELDAAIAAGDSAGVTAAAQAVVAKLDAEIAKAQGALTPAPVV